MKSDKGKNSRARRGVTTAVVGLALNVLLAASKLIAGIISGSVSVLSDAVNNFSDAGGSVVALLSFAISGKKADREHPYGHGRSEYVANFIISVLVIFVAVELARASVSRLVTPVTATFSVFALVTMCVSIVIKGGMTVLYIVRNASVRSDTLRAAALDSASDCAVTAVITISLVLGRLVSFPLDAAVGLAASVLVGIGGIKIIVRTVNKLMGSSDTGEVEKQIFVLLSEYPQVLGFHDLRVHDYGEVNKVASVDAELDEKMSFAEVHEIVDRIERKAYIRYSINLVVHCDPVPTDDERYLGVRREVVLALEGYGRNASFHELTIDDESSSVSLHLRLSEALMREKESVCYTVKERLEKALPDYDVKIEYDFM